MAFSLSDPKARLTWGGTQGLPSVQYTCGFCGKDVASITGWDATSELSGGGPARPAFIRICHYCTLPSLFDNRGRTQVPGALPGRAVQNITDGDVEALYAEARRALKANAASGCVLLCRKLLMHLAVAKGAQENLSFVAYVNYLVDNHHVPPGSKEWIDDIRGRGNEANHEIVVSTRAEGEEILSLVEMLLQLMYEYPARVRASRDDKSKPSR